MLRSAVLLALLVYAAAGPCDDGRCEASARGQGLLQIGLRARHGNSSDQGSAPEPKDLSYLNEVEELFQNAVTELRGRMDNFISEVDTDHDGVMSLKELVQKYPDKGQEMFSHFDANKDGSATLAECVQQASGSILKSAESSALNLAKQNGHVLTMEEFRDDLEAIRNGTRVIPISAVTEPSAQEVELQQQRWREMELAALDVGLNTSSKRSSQVAGTRRRRDSRWHDNVDPLVCGPTDNRCKSLQKLSNRAAWKKGMAIFKLLTESDFCWRNHYDRGPGAGRWCKEGYSQGGLLCYPHCPSGYRRFGDHCWQDCRGGYDDLGVTCCEVRWDFWSSRGCHDKGVKYMPGKGLLDSSVTRCPPDKPNDDAGLCYPNPKTDYSCTLTACNINCKSVMGTDCGVGACSASSESCKHNILTFIDGSIQAVLDTAILVVSFGSASTMKVAASAAQKAALRSAARGNMRRIAIRVGKQEFKQEYRRLVRRAAMKAVKDAVKGKATDHFMEQGIGAGLSAVSNEELSKAMASSGRSAEALADTIVQEMSNSAKDFDFKNLDFTGVSGVVDAMNTNAPAHEMAAAWLNMLSTIDPTGWLAAAANFAKPQCEGIYDQLDELDVQEDNPDDDGAWGGRRRGTGGWR